MELGQEVMTLSLTNHETRCDGKHLRVEFAIFSSERVIFVCPKLVGWLHSERAQMLEFVDSLQVMFVLLHKIWLAQRLWSTNLIVAGRSTQPTPHGVRIVLVAIIIGTVIVEVIVVGFFFFFFEVGSRLVRSRGSLRFGSIRLQRLVDP